MQLYDHIPEGLTPAQRERAEKKLSRTMCMNVDWFADRAFTCPDSLEGTVDTYARIAMLDCHNAEQSLNEVKDLATWPAEVRRQHGIGV